jgi:hypothetical protein
MAVEALLQDLREGDGIEAQPHALIVILVTFGTAAEQALILARQWQPSVPQAAFVGIALAYAARQPDIAALRRDIATAASSRSLHMSQTILLGADEAGRLALDIVLQGVVPAMGVIGLDIAPGPVPSRIAHTAAMVRLIHHRAGERTPAGFRAVVEAMRRSDVDVRTMMLPDAAQPDHAQTASGIMQRAGATFLAELVANASRSSLATRR